MVTDPIADLMIRIKNAYLAGRPSLTVPYSRVKESIAKILEMEHFVNKVTVINAEQVTQKALSIDLRYSHKKPLVTHVVRISKPGRRIYAKAGAVPRVKYGYGLTIVSTSAGFMSHKQAAKKKVGGEIICQIW
jgi:small subunit ribosomal protein S8